MRSVSIRTVLSLQVAALVVPTALIAAGFAYQAYRNGLASGQAAAVQTCRAMVLTVEAESAQLRGMAQTLATSPSLIQGNLADFYRQAQQIRAHSSALNVAVSDRSGQQVLNTLRPLDSKLPRHANPALVASVLSRRAPMVSDLYLDEVTRRPMLSISVPVPVAQQTSYVLEVGVQPAVFSRIIASQALPPDWVVAIFDRQGTIVARSHRPEDFVGKKGSPGLLEAMRARAQGTVETLTLEGIPVSSAFSRAETSGWVVAIDVPQANLREGLRHTLWRSLLAAAGLLACGLWLAMREERDRASDLPSISVDVTESRIMNAQLALAAMAFESQEGILITDPHGNILRANQALLAASGYGAEALLGQPITRLRSNRHDSGFFAAMRGALGQQGVWRGELWCQRKDGQVFPTWTTITAIRDPQGKLSNYVVTQTDTTARKAAEDEMRRLAYFDVLTGLPNRRMLMERLRLACATGARHGRFSALMFIDLDNFKQLNDTLGHDQGDALLRQVGRRLPACVRDGDTVARLGGDEFVVMLESLGATQDEAALLAEAVGHKLLAALNLPYDLVGQSIRCTPSIGVTLFADHSLRAEQMLKQADLAMYEAKANGRNSVRFFEPRMQALVDAHAELEHELRTALEQGDFELHFQAQVGPARNVIGAEALVRWRHHRRGMIGPDDFIPLAEETGLILQLGQWVLRTACAQLARWRQRPEQADLVMAVNVSVRQFRQPDFVAQVLAALRESGADPTRLKLELSESLLRHDFDDIVLKMTLLKREGVSFALDDFGVGYSSLSDLKRLPIDQLKIDRSFVRDVLTDANDSAIARVIVAFARTLGLSILAEGVETEDQCHFLLTHHCYAFQGYLFSRPLRTAEFDAMFA